jgi:SAM-dependent methyltransferase
MSEYLKKYVSKIENKFENKLVDQSRMLNHFNRVLNFFDYREITKETSFLDLGSGDGSFYHVCKNKNLNIFKIDGAEGIDFESDKINFEDETFDLIIFNAVIEHLYSPVNVLKEINRMLKKGSPLIIVTPNFTYAYKNFYDDPMHVHPYTPKSLKKVLSLNNFRNIKIIPNIINKSKIYWSGPFKFWLASHLPFKNHTYKNYPIPKFIRGHSTGMLSICNK